MKYFECEDGKIRSIGYVIMQAMFSYEMGSEPETHEFEGYAIVGFEKLCCPFSSSHFLFTSYCFDECARKLAEYRYELENFPDDVPDPCGPVPDNPDELPF